MSEKVKSNFNDVTGETIASVKGNQKAYESGWERIFGKKENEHPHSNSGVRYTGMAIPETIAVFEEECITTPFMEEPLPSGITEDEV